MSESYLEDENWDTFMFIWASIVTCGLFALIVGGAILIEKISEWRNKNK